MKKILTVLSFLVISAALSASGAQDAAGDSSSSLKVAALLPGPINDGGWNTSMYESLKHQEEVLGAEIAYTENTPESDYEEIFRTYAESGFTVIFGHGFQFGEAAKKVAPNYPDTVFIVNSSTFTQEPNLGSFLVNDFECGFAQGAIAALTSESDLVAFIGGVEIPPIAAQGAGFVAGAKYINPDIDARLIMTGSFTDIARAKEVASSLIEEGADVLIGDANEAGLGVVEAAEEAGVYTMGCSSDLYEAAPDMKDAILASVVEDTARGHELIIRDVMSGNFVPKNYLIGFKDEGAVTLTSFRDKESLYTAEEMETIMGIIEGLSDGSIDVEQYK